MSKITVSVFILLSIALVAWQFMFPPQDGKQSTQAGSARKTAVVVKEVEKTDSAPDPFQKADKLSEVVTEDSTPGFDMNAGVDVSKEDSAQTESVLSSKDSLVVFSTSSAFTRESLRIQIESVRRKPVLIEETLAVQQFLSAEVSGIYRRYGGLKSRDGLVRSQTFEKLVYAILINESAGDTTLKNSCQISDALLFDLNAAKYVDAEITKGMLVKAQRENLCLKLITVSILHYMRGIDGSKLYERELLGIASHMYHNGTRTDSKIFKRTGYTFGKYNSVNGRAGTLVMMEHYSFDDLRSISRGEKTITVQDFPEWKIDSNDNGSWECIWHGRQ